MGSTSSRVNRPAPVETGSVVPVEIESAVSATANTAIFPGIPREILDEILDYLKSDLSSIRSCALVSKLWLPSCRRHLFHTVHFTFESFIGWHQAFPAPKRSPAHCIRDLHVSTGGPEGSPGGLFLKHAPWIMDVEKVTFSGGGRWIPMFWRLPQSITSLTMRTDAFSLVQTREILAQLPNLDDLSLSGALVPVKRRALPGIGTVLGGRFGGRLQLLREYAEKDTMNMLLEAPAGLRFTEVEICSMWESLFSTVRLTETCCKTLVKLSYTISSYYERVGFEQSFDFSKFPSLQEVEFAVGWMNGGLAWIPRALSTIEPATSPRLSTVQLNFTRPPTAARRPVEALVVSAGKDLRWVTGEVARIKREFEGAVYLAVHWDPLFKAAFDAVKARQRRDR